MKVSELLAMREINDILSPLQIRSIQEIAAAFETPKEHVFPDGDTIKIWCDGSCLGNPGRGGWAACFENGMALYGNDGGASTTNNRMEIMAAIQALHRVPMGSEVIVHTDSQLVVKTMTEGWSTGKNKDLWAELFALAKNLHITWVWVRGHNGDPMNEAADKLAREAANMTPIHGVKERSAVCVTRPALVSQ